ncbi:MAG: hypothetical protein JW955_14765 [Sedimentisphaerales bacterium]|nr:hypothetical protein [Sedimentisphaerales bacterium]
MGSQENTSVPSDHRAIAASERRHRCCDETVSMLLLSEMEHWVLAETLENLSMCNGPCVSHLVCPREQLDTFVRRTVAITR